MVDKKQSRGLGRGLSALMSDVNIDSAAAMPSGPVRADQMVALDRIRPNPDQPRRSFSAEALQELSESIKEKGVIQPLIVRTDPNNASGFEIVAGERRWRAAQLAKLHEVPVIVRELSDVEVLEVAIIENIQRADLNPIDEAAGYRQLIDRFGHTQEQLAQAMGKSRSHITNLMRLLNLPNDVQTQVIEGRISAGHARALVGRDDANALARQIIAGNLSVRDTERLVKSADRNGQSKSAAPSEKDPDTIQVERDLAATLGLKVSIDHKSGSGRGKLVLHYKSLEQLDDLMQMLTGSRA